MVIKKGKRSKKIIKKRSKIVKKQKKSVKKGGKRSFRNKGRGGGHAVPEFKRHNPLFWVQLPQEQITQPPNTTITNPITQQYPSPYDNTYETHIHAPNIPLQYDIGSLID
tara:strand:- start:6 stop:335 length:330 start_codon:yes stop_codon:yes gene_type:complete